MSKYRKKPVVVEAFQMTEERRQDNSEWPNWLHMAWQLERDEPGAVYPTKRGTSDGTLSIMTLEGPHYVSWGDYIIQGIEGELYPCKPSIFEASYESVVVADGQELVAEPQWVAIREGLICVVFDGPPGLEAGRFVEVETRAGESVKFGAWRERDDGKWSLDIPLTLTTCGVDHSHSQAELDIKEERAKSRVKYDDSRYGNPVQALGDAVAAIVSGIGADENPGHRTRPTWAAKYRKLSTRDRLKVGAAMLLAAMEHLDAHPPEQAPNEEEPAWRPSHEEG